MAGSDRSEAEHADGTPEDAARCDVLVVGGGPAGSTVSSLLAGKGHRVVLLEKDRHPRFHIGESLLPMNLPIFERLGVLDEVRGIGVYKPGIEMFSRREPGKSQSFYFDKASGPPFGYAFQVRRSEFDHLLLRNAARRGVEVHEGVRVGDVDLRSGGTTLVRARDEAGEERAWACRFLVDASGRNALLSTRLGLKRKNEKHNSAAVFGHFRKVPRSEGPDGGNIRLFWFEHGWFWVIPLNDGVTSVGAVCWPDYLKSRDTDLETFLRRTIALCPALEPLMREAELDGPARATGNYSYRSTRMWGDGYLLVGDAYAFVDPVFSSGVYLAMNSAVEAAEAVHASLVLGRPAKAELRRFERRVKTGLRTWSWFIYRFTTPAIQTLFMAPRNTFGMEGRIVSLLAGDVFGRRPLADPIRLFKAIYYVTSVFDALRSWTSWRRRRRNVRLTLADSGV